MKSTTTVSASVCGGVGGLAYNAHRTDFLSLKKQTKKLKNIVLAMPIVQNDEQEKCEVSASRPWQSPVPV